jgi:N-acetylneuraminic acid mutarotase
MCALLFSAVTLSALALNAVGTWTRVADMRTARSAHAVVATETGIYVLAGTGPDGKPVTSVERFDGKTWANETTLPGEGLNAPAAAALENSIYVIGGFGTTTNRPVTTVHRYDPVAKKWDTAAPLPAPRGGHAAAVLNGRIHVFGGGNSVSTIDDHSIYDPKTNTWSAGAPLPRRMGSPAAAVLNGKLYSIGGRSGPNDFGDVHIYDPATDRWVAGPAIPARGTGGAAVSNGSILYFGGESQSGQAVLGDVLRLAPGGAEWVKEAPPMPIPRSYARVVTFRGAIYVVGGSTEYGASHSSKGSATVERFEPGRN